MRPQSGKQDVIKLNKNVVYVYVSEYFAILIQPLVRFAALMAPRADMHGVFVFQDCAEGLLLGMSGVLASEDVVRARPVRWQYALLALVPLHGVVREARLSLPLKGANKGKQTMERIRIVCAGSMCRAAIGKRILRSHLPDQWPRVGGA